MQGMADVLVGSGTKLFSGGYASRLKQELSARAIAWAETHGFAHERTLGSIPAVLFREDEQGRHGNFYPASYRRIRRRPEWSRRLNKVHTSARRHLVSHDPDRRELDSSNSSDALLMSVFCHPMLELDRRTPLHDLLGLETATSLRFGYKPRIPLHSNHVECTEVDLLAGDLLIEAKLTEGDFQTAANARIERYRDADEVFDYALLTGEQAKVKSYQLIRGALAAFAGQGRRFCVICDARRPDLLDAWFAVIRMVRCYELRSRLQIVTWQEIAAVMPASFQLWLREKYGIHPQ